MIALMWITQKSMIKLLFISEMYQMWYMILSTFSVRRSIVLQDTVDWGSRWFVDFNAGKTQLVSCDHSINTGATDMKMNGSVLEEKSSFKMLGLTLSSKLDWGSYIISIAKVVSKILEPFFVL